MTFEPGPRERAARLTLANGGGTFRNGTFEPVNPDSGYAVGVARGYGHRFFRDIEPVQGEYGCIVDADVQRIIYALGEVRMHNEAPYIGTWIRTLPSGVREVVIDPVMIVADRGSALIVAKAFGQDAIYAFETGEEIPA